FPLTPNVRDILPTDPQCKGHSSTDHPYQGPLPPSIHMCPAVPPPLTCKGHYLPSRVPPHIHISRTYLPQSLTPQLRDICPAESPLNPYMPILPTAPPSCNM
ncbi:unnamed protein product, partial [Staurois parvus]